MLVHFETEASAIAPGQSAVFYIGKRVDVYKRQVVQSAFYRNRQVGRQGISQCDTYIAYVAHLLGYERAVGISSAG